MNVQHEHKVTVAWTRSGAEFLTGRYSREHCWTFDGGAVISASASPSIVPVPYSNPAHVDPEEAFVAAVSSCHMLWYLSLACKEGFLVESYADEATGLMTKNDQGVLWISSITLRPKVVYDGTKLPNRDQSDRLHHLAHEKCFIANSIKTSVEIVAA